MTTFFLLQFLCFIQARKKGESIYDVADSVSEDYDDEIASSEDEAEELADAINDLHLEGDQS